MMIAALETATRRGSVAVYVDGVVHAHVGDAARTHGERLPDELTAIVAARGCELRDVELYAVVSGPGSFTGLRVGIATVQGLALAAGRRVVAVPTLEALARSWFEAAPRPVSALVTCLDGQRGEIFLAALDLAGDADGGARREIIEPTVARADLAVALVASRVGDRPAAVVGDGAMRYADLFTRMCPSAAVMESPLPLAAAAVHIAAEHPDRAVAPHALRPVYLRRPDAVLARDRDAVGDGTNAGAFTVRLAGHSEELAAVERLQQQTFTNPWGAAAIRWELENTDVARLYLMHDAAGVLVAYCSCWMIFDELHINSLAVDLGRRRQGLARRLLEQVLREAVAEGARSATLEVRDSNRAARCLYERLGFRVEAVRRDYYRDPREDAVILWNRTLGESAASTSGIEPV